MADAGIVTLRSAAWPADRAGVAALFREYEGSLTGSLPAILCFQGFEQELADLPGAYAPPRGDVLLAELEGALVGVGALRPLDAEICEMKRLYVRPAQRGTGLGERLAVALLQAGRRTGYRAMRLDTHVSMAAATALYRKLGFREIPPYSAYSADGLLYFERSL
jgi:ribosomal protein S18 acetylase RimI-like enzyme